MARVKCCDRAPPRVVPILTIALEADTPLFIVYLAAGPVSQIRRFGWEMTPNAMVEFFPLSLMFFFKLSYPFSVSPDALILTTVMPTPPTS